MRRLRGHKTCAFCLFQAFSRSACAFSGRIREVLLAEAARADLFATVDHDTAMTSCFSFCRPTRDELRSLLSQAELDELADQICGYPIGCRKLKDFSILRAEDFNTLPSVPRRRLRAILHLISMTNFHRFYLSCRGNLHDSMQQLRIFSRVSHF